MAKKKKFHSGTKVWTKLRVAENRAIKNDNAADIKVVEGIRKWFLEAVDLFTLESDRKITDEQWNLLKTIAKKRPCNYAAPFEETQMSDEANDLKLNETSSENTTTTSVPTKECPFDPTSDRDVCVYVFTQHNPPFDRRMRSIAQDLAAFGVVSNMVKKRPYATGTLSMLKDRGEEYVRNEEALKNKKAEVAQTVAPPPALTTISSPTLTSTPIQKVEVLAESKEGKVELRTEIQNILKLPLSFELKVKCIEGVVNGPSV